MEKISSNSKKIAFRFEKCKLLLSKGAFHARSVDIIFDDVITGYLYRTVSCERIRFFDSRILSSLFYFAGTPARAAVAYSFNRGACRIASSREIEPEAYAAAVFSLYCNQRIAPAERIVVTSDVAEFSASVIGDTVTLFA